MVEGTESVSGHSFNALYIPGLGAPEEGGYLTYSHYGEMEYFDPRSGDTKLQPATKLHIEMMGGVKHQPGIGALLLRAFLERYPSGWITGVPTAHNLEALMDAFIAYRETPHAFSLSEMVPFLRVAAHELKRDYFLTPGEFNRPGESYYHISAVSGLYHGDHMTITLYPAHPLQSGRCLNFQKFVTEYRKWIEGLVPREQRAEWRQRRRGKIRQAHQDFISSLSPSDWRTLFG